MWYSVNERDRTTITDSGEGIMRLKLCWQQILKKMGVQGMGCARREVLLHTVLDDKDIKLSHSIWVVMNNLVRKV